MKTVFIPPIVDWSFLKQLPQQIAEQFHKNGYRVIYCGVNKGVFFKREVKENLFIYSSADYALKEIEEQNIKIDIFYNTWAYNHFLIDILEPELTIYHSCDLFDEWKQYEPEIIKKADLVFCTSEYIYNIRKNQHKNVYLCRNGCNEEMIDSQDFKELDVFKFIRRPIFGFCGAIGKWVSTNYMRSVGDKYYTAMAGIEFGKNKPSNIADIGQLNHNQLKDFYYSCTFGMLPFDVKSEITLAANPIKLYEYLACGLPVLATKWGETDLEEYKDVVFPAKSKEQFLEYAENLAELDVISLRELRQECFKVAKNNTWEKRFQIIEEQIEKRGIENGKNLIVESCT